MKCPACEKNLQQMTIGEVCVDVCVGSCGGIWFDNFEVKKFDEPHEAEGELLLDTARDPTIRVDHNKRRPCPKCAGVVMRRFLFSPNDDIEVDECPACAGMWLDAGELQAIRSKFASEKDRKAAAEKFLEGVIGPKLSVLRAESNEKLEKARRVAEMFRFICPSYWIPGKQEWGAF